MLVTVPLYFLWLDYRLGSNIKHIVGINDSSRILRHHNTWYSAVCYLVSFSHFSEIYASFYGRDFTQGLGEILSSMFQISKEESRLALSVRASQTAPTITFTAGATTVVVTGESMPSSTLGTLPSIIRSRAEERQGAIAVVAASLPGCHTTLQTNTAFAEYFFDSRSLRSSVFNEGLSPLVALCRIVMPADRELFLQDVCELLFTDMNLKEQRSRILMVSMCIQEVEEYMNDFA